MNICERLDRGVANEAWLRKFSDATIRHLPYSFSDHCPLLIQFYGKVRNEQEIFFMFEAWWLMEESFKAVVKKIWDNDISDIFCKLTRLRLGLTEWARGIHTQRNTRKA